MKNPDYNRGVQAAFEALQSGETKHACLKAVNPCTDQFDQGWVDQCLAWPEVLPLPQPAFEETDGSVVQGIFAGIGLTAFLGFIFASGPAAGILFIIAVLSGLAAYRLKK